MRPILLRDFFLHGGKVPSIDQLYEEKQQQRVLYRNLTSEVTMYYLVGIGRTSVGPEERRPVTVNQQREVLMREGLPKGRNPRS